MNRLLSIPAICITLSLSACSSTPQHTMQLGDAVKQLTADQTHNPEASQQHGTQLHGSYDGQTGVNVMSTYRTHIDKPQEIKNEIQVNIGN